MPNGKPPKTTGEHLVSLYGYVQGFKRQIDHLHQDVGKLEKKTDTVIYWIIGGAFTTILTLAFPDRLSEAESILMTQYISMCGLVGAYFGFSAISGKR